MSDIRSSASCNSWHASRCCTWEVTHRLDLVFAMILMICQMELMG